MYLRASSTIYSTEDHDNMPLQAIRTVAKPQVRSIPATMLPKANASDRMALAPSSCSVTDSIFTIATTEAAVEA